jgi:cholesterol oxidase
MLYRLHFADAAGNPVTLVGFKDVHDDPGLDIWRDTSTLYTTLYSGHVAITRDTAAPGPADQVIGAGILTIHVPDFLHQLTTFRTNGGSSKEQAAALGRFGRLFLGSLWDVYAARVLSSGPV